MKEIQRQYIPEYNHYCAMTGYRGGFAVWLKWRNTQAVKQFS